MICTSPQYISQRNCMSAYGNNNVIYKTPINYFMTTVDPPCFSLQMTRLSSIISVHNQYKIQAIYINIQTFLVEPQVIGLCAWRECDHNTILHCPTKSAVAVFELSVLSDRQFCRVGWREAVVQVLHAIALLHLCQGTHQPRVGCIQRAYPLLLKREERGRGRD